jgi:hypothetical protein
MMNLAKRLVDRKHSGKTKENIIITYCLGGVIVSLFVKSLVPKTIKLSFYASLLSMWH